MSERRQGTRVRVELPYLLAWRVWRGLSQGELHQRSGVSINTLSRLENGKGAANFATIGKLATALGISREDLMRKDPTATQQARGAVA
jgi:transcriptional regulator with XRE-family HTH domain